MASKRAEARKAEIARNKRQATLDSIEARLVRIEAALGISDEPDYEAMSVSELEQVADKLGIHIEQGSGKDGNVLKRDLVDALQA